jgi:Dyp-type peroxidase family
LHVTYREVGVKFEDREHFGFRDGISQPRVIGFHPDGDFEAGHFVFGYPRSPGAPPITVQRDPRGITRNGSLLVVRRLRQDVARFRSFCQAEADRLQAVWPGLTSDHLQALLVGRWPSGALVSAHVAADPGRPPAGENDFDFTDDQDGARCPFGSHIRKVNPRNGPRDVVDVPRMLRRGIPFGPPYHEAPDVERGLLFLSFQTSITDTFEFISAKWMNVPEKPAPAAGHDVIVGRSHLPRAITMKSPFGLVTVSDGGQEWVTPTGGAYLFAPGRSGLAKLDTPPEMSVRTRLAIGWRRAADSLARY